MFTPLSKIFPLLFKQKETYPAMGPYGVTELDNFLTRSNPKAFYRKFGFGLYRQAIDADVIDNLVRLLKEEVYNFSDCLPRFGEKRPPRFTEDGVLIGGLEQPHSYREPKVAGFTAAWKNLISHPRIKQILASVDGGDTYCIEQSQMFTLSPATPVHIDSFSADSWPRGHSHTIWIALQDIPLDAGPPFVIPSSENILSMEFPNDHPVRKSENPNGAANRIHHEAMVALPEWENIQKTQFSTALSKGDIMIWHSLTVHGTTQRKLPKAERLSMQVIYLDMKRESGTYLGPAPTESVPLNQDFYMRPYRY